MDDWNMLGCKDSAQNALLTGKVGGNLMVLSHLEG